MSKKLKVYCDTNTLPGNIGDPDELAALERLACHEGIELVCSHLGAHEASNTKSVQKRNVLVAEHNTRRCVEKDEKLLGFNTQTDWRGGFICSPLISDVQDESIRAELIDQGLEPRDAEHVTQAVCNKCDVFLTRDQETIIEPHRTWLEERFRPMKIFLPMELVTFIDAVGSGSV
ncbi:MAG: hypothetical protein LAO23_21820 [Acidobacteriia bacterium]|nr:hypothetical protein [Terriglobia bacterium]